MIHRSAQFVIHLPAHRLLQLIMGLSIAVFILLTASLSHTTSLAAGNQSAAARPAQTTTGCIEGQVIDDLHVGLPGWTVHARPAGAATPVLTDVTDGFGFYHFGNLAVGDWTFWVEVQTGWAPVTPTEFTVTVAADEVCQYTRFKFKQATPTPTPTPTIGPATRIRGYVMLDNCQEVV
ncbi:MAG: carboxypeptidase regulatory-like domain-containing protein, partial [Chloroflexi bacterium]|nr:carboxypeptidase regulatory-like domain-containing protein [Chloroflexota bacterium]